MPRTPDRFPGPREDEAIVLEEQAAEPAPGELRNVGGILKGGDAGGPFELRGVTAEQHEDLDTLVHRLAESAYLEVVRDTSGRLASSTYWTDATRTMKVREQILTRDPQGRVATLEDRQYDAAGQLAASLTTTFARNAAGRVTSANLVEA